MALTSALFIFMLCFHWGCGRKPYIIAKLESNGSMYLLLNDWAKLLPDVESITSLGFEATTLESISLADLSNKYKLRSPAPTLRYTDRSMDDITRVELIKSAVLNGDLLREAVDIGQYINPCITKWQNRLILVTGLSWGVAGAKQKPPTNTLNIRWLNYTAFPFHTSEQYMGIYNEIEEFPSMVLGQDPRVVVHEDPERFEVYYTNQFEKIARMGMAEITINHTTGNITVSRNYFTIHPTVDWKSPQKNWTPFVYLNEVLLVNSINPYQVMKTSVQREDNRMLAYKESAVDAVELHWPYGDLRGGTNAIYLPDQKVYFAIFHSAGHSPGNHMKTYVMGAYTFTATPPFRLLSISPFPIMPPQFYNGPWHPMKQRQIDYCLFPLSVFVEGETLYLSAGFQDSRGLLLKFKLQEVLDSMVPV